MAYIKLITTAFQRLLPVKCIHNPILLRQNCIELSNSFHVTSEKKTNEALEIEKVLKNNFPLAKNIQIVDISHGCGGMYEIMIESSEFSGLTLVKQHRLVNEALKDHIKNLHGLRIQTLVPS